MNTDTCELDSEPHEKLLVNAIKRKRNQPQQIAHKFNSFSWTALDKLISLMWTSQIGTAYFLDIHERF